jgi:tetratricopeptide (TPR) repeat protein
MLPLVSATPQRLAGAFVAVSMLGVGFIPLFGGPGYEHSLASGLLVPSSAAIATACELSRDDVPVPLPVACVGRGVRSGLGLSALAFATALVHAARVGMCDLAGGAVGFVLTAVVGAMLGGVWGAVVAEVARGRKRRRLVAVLGAIGLPLASALVSVGRFYTSPMIFAFDPFVGYFSGTLYDTVIDAGNALITYRVGSVATLAFVALLSTVLTRDPGHRLCFVPVGRRRRPGVRWRAVLAVCALGVSVWITAHGPALGHWETSSTIAAELGGERAGERCDVVHPASLLRSEVDLLVKDCDEEVAAVERTLGAKGPDRIRAFFFRDSGEKKRLMGAADTLIAKPWRREVYVQLSVYPHPVLGHELAHVIAGSFGRGPFRIAGSAGGLWPDPGLIEGVAVAASPDDDELTDTQWAHAMLELGTLPPIHELFSLGFLNVAASKSYTLAGAFVRFILETRGSETVRAWYGGASLALLTGKSWTELEAEFQARVAATSLAPEAQSFAKARFERAAVFGRKCPHVVDALRRKADLCRDSHEVERATAAYDEVLALDPHDWGARYGLGVVNLHYGREALGTETLRELARAEETPRTWRDRAKDALADADFLRGDYAAAADAYRALAERSLEEDFARTEEIKLGAAVGGGGGSGESGETDWRDAVQPLLLGEPGRPGDVVIAAERAGEWEARTHGGVAAYLVGRTMLGRGWYAAAVPHLDRAIHTPSLGGRILREAVRLRAVAACALGDRDGVEQMRALVESTDGPYASSTGRRLSVARLLHRCTTSPLPRVP